METHIVIREPKKVRPIRKTQGDRYVVKQLGTLWEVRLWFFENGHRVADQLLAVFPTEREADAAARELTMGAEVDEFA